MPLALDEIVMALSGGEPPGFLQPRVLFRAKIPVELDAGGPVVFIPDLHVLSTDRGVGYGDAYHLNADRKALLLTLLADLSALRRDRSEFANLLLYQLGDFHDLWREALHWWGGDVRQMLERQWSDHADLFSAFLDLSMQRLVGNHDDALRDSRARTGNDDLWPAAAIHPETIEFSWGRIARVLLIHADQVDSVEGHFYNPIGARLAGSTPADEWKHEVTGPGWPDPLAPNTLVQRNVNFTDPAFTGAQKKFYPEIARFNPQPPDTDPALFHLSRLAAFIGHTHAPRIVVDDEPAALAMIDCGSWVNISTDEGAANSSFSNAQIGVLTGNESAVVQLGPV